MKKYILTGFIILNTLSITCEDMNYTYNGTPYTDQDFNDAMDTISDIGYQVGYALIPNPIDDTDPSLDLRTISMSSLSGKIALDHTVKSLRDYATEKAGLPSEVPAEFDKMMSTPNYKERLELSNRLTNYLGERDKIYNEAYENSFAPDKQGFARKFAKIFDRAEDQKTHQQAVDIANKKMAEKNWFGQEPQLTPKEKQEVVEILQNTPTAESQSLLDIILNPFVAIPVVTAALGYAYYKFFYNTPEKPEAEEQKTSDEQPQPELP